MFTSIEKAKALYTKNHEAFKGLEFNEAHELLLKSQNEYFKPTHSKGCNWVNKFYPEVADITYYYKGLSPLFEGEYLSAKAFVCGGKLYINEESFDRLSNDSKHALLAHELVHLKHFKQKVFNVDDATDSKSWYGIKYSNDNQMSEMELPWEREAYFTGFLKHPESAELDRYQGNDLVIAKELLLETKRHSDCIFSYQTMLSDYRVFKEDNPKQTISFHDYYETAVDNMCMYLEDNATNTPVALQNTLNNIGLPVKYINDAAAIKTFALNPLCAMPFVVVEGDRGLTIVVNDYRINSAHDDLLEYSLKIVKAYVRLFNEGRFCEINNYGVIWDGELYLESADNQEEVKPWLVEFLR